MNITASKVTLIPPIEKKRVGPSHNVTVQRVLHVDPANKAQACFIRFGKIPFHCIRLLDHGVQLLLNIAPQPLYFLPLRVLLKLTFVKLFFIRCFY